MLDQWVPQYAILPRKASRLYDLGHPLRICLDSVSRFIYERIRRVLARISGRFWARLLAIQLVVLLPWTTLLAAANGEAWFGDESIKWAWVTFNALLGISLMALTRLLWIQHPIARRMSMFLAGATMTDAVLSTAQAVQLHSTVQGWALVFLGVTGPCVATAFLVYRHCEPIHRA